MKHKISNLLFIKFAEKIVKHDCIVWAYDALQKCVFNVKIQNTKNTFENKFGAKRY